MKDGEQLPQASRIYFGVHHTVQFNVKVKDLGYVHPQWMAVFIGYWSMKQGVDTKQDAEVTAEAEEGYDELDDDEKEGKDYEIVAR